MKKTYINPEMVVVPFVATRPIATSVFDIGGDTEIFRGDDDDAPITADTKSLINNHNVWDDEW